MVDCIWVTSWWMGNESESGFSHHPSELYLVGS
jgi:hypothetical protein